ncbi:Exopolyphosphatase [Roseibium album]|nr:Exopolyphosphatase [Roseibium album]
MTQSGQEPPGNRRGATDASGNSRTPSESSGPNKRRRKRRSGKGPKGGSAAVANGSAFDSPQGTESVSVPAENRTVVHGQNAPAILNSGENTTSSNKHRKKRRRGKNRRPQSAIEPVNGVVADGSNEPSLALSDTVTSLKGKKAARRRGRRRGQSGNVSAQQTPAQAGTQVPEVSPPVQQSDNAPEEIRGRGTKNNGGKEVHHPHPQSEHKRGMRNAHSREPVRQSTNGSQLYAALDLGTNNCRLLIARPEERGFRVVDAYSRIVRLGEGVGSNRRLSDAAMDRAIDALANCHRKLADRGVMRSRLIATEACRAAENGAEFIDRVQAETGLALEVVNRETEARLAVAGCASLVSHDADGVILFDIGGGSSEIVWLDLRNRCGARGFALTRFIRSWISLPVGVVNLAERHGGVHVTPDIFEAMVEDAGDHLDGFNLSDNLSEAIASGRVHMLGTSGTVTTLAGVHLGLKRYDRRRVDGTWLRDEEVSKMIDQLRDMPYEARVENPCIGADRADLVLAGCAILEAIRRRWTCSKLRVADRGLREGILTELMAADGVWAHKRSGYRHRGNRQRKRV